MADPTPDILVVDDDKRLAQLIRRYLGDNGFRVTVAGSAEEAKGLLATLAFDLLVLDVMMPGLSGVELTRELRRGNDVPILLLTAMSEPENRISGLESGADDYLTKPFEPRELVLRLNSILRRRPKAAEPAPAELRFGRFRFDPVRGELWQGEEPVRLAGAEVSLLRAFARRPNEAIARLDLVDGAAGLGPRTVDVQVTRLRRKLEADPKFPRHLQTVRGKGYLFRTD
jgi:two-component system, OmpR family, phosphate regulon response regulator OmpR